MKQIKRIKIIYGDGTVERYLSTEDYAEAWEAARRRAKERGTIVRGYSRVGA